MEINAGLDRLAGVVQKIIYRSEDSFFTVALLQASAGTIHTVCGYFYVLLTGDELILYGEPAVHPRYGEQFQVQRYEKPFSPHFSNGQAGPPHWQQVEGMLMEVQSLGLSMEEALKAFTYYGEEVQEIIQENPYRLTQDPVGLPFVTADRVAQRLGIPCESEYRLQSAVLQVLTDALTAGHTCILWQEAEGRIQTLLTRIQESGLESPDSLLTAVEQMAEAGLIVLDDDLYLYRADVFTAEQNAAFDLMRLVNSWSGPLLVDPAQALQVAEKQVGMTLSATQRQVLASVLAHPVSIITGGPGTGKTTILRTLLEACAVRAPQKKILLAAPTGRAAKRLSELTGHEAQTIHRLLEARGSDAQTVFDRHRDHPLEGNLLIVDESSMVDLFLFSRLLAALPSGMGLILVGDVNQLPSVGPGHVLRDLIHSEVFAANELATVYRQEEASEIVLSAHRIHQGQLPFLHTRQEEFVFLSRETPDEITATLEEQLDLLMDRGYTLDDLQILCPFHRGDTGTGSLNRRIRDRFNPWEPGVPEARGTYELFRRGDKVMQMRNDYQKGVFNGNIGHITQIDTGSEPALEVQFEDQVAVYTAVDMDDLSLAYAITVHKSQGSEFPVVLMPVYWPLRAPVTRNLIYTAVTRARHRVLLIGRKQDLLWAIRNNRSGQRCTRLGKRFVKN